MTNDHDTRDASQGDSPPDRGAAGDISTTGHSSRETGGSSTTLNASGPTIGHAHEPDSHGSSGHDDLAGDHDDHGHGHGGHGAHGDEASDVPTIVPTTWRQLIFPTLILILVAILVAGPISNAFQSRPAAATQPTQHENPANTGEGSDHNATPTEAPTHLEATPGAESTPTVASSTVKLPTPTPPYDVAATKTAVAKESDPGKVSRAPVSLDFGGTSFVVKAGNTLLPDWKPPQDPGIATWIEGSVANHILYLPYSPQNAALFQAGKKGDKITLLMNTGKVFEFEVTRSERVQNGPPTADGQFTVTTAMAQDHAGVTLFLIGDPSQDRAVVQADFTGNIQ